MKHRPLSRREANLAGERRLRGIGLGLGGGSFKGVGSINELGEGGVKIGFEEIGEGGAWVTKGDEWEE